MLIEERYVKPHPHTLVRLFHGWIFLLSYHVLIRTFDRVHLYNMKPIYSAPCVNIYGLGPRCILSAVKLAVEACERHAPQLVSTTTTDTAMMIDDYKVCRSNHLIPSQLFTNLMVYFL